MTANDSQTGPTDTPANFGLPASIVMPATGALQEAGITTLDQIAEYWPANLLALHGIEPHAVWLLTEVLAARR